jgi:hypothetical protein
MGGIGDKCGNEVLFYFFHLDCRKGTYGLRVMEGENALVENRTSSIFDSFSCLPSPYNFCF